MDSSESIGSTNFALAKDFIITVIDRLAKDQQVKVSRAQSHGEFCGSCCLRLCVVAKKHFASCLETEFLGKVETTQK